MALTMHGQAGELRAGYQPAARLGAWELEATAGGGFTIHAAVASRDAYWFERRPLDVRLTVGRGVWRWRAVEVSPNGTGASVVIIGTGRPEVTR